MKKTQRARHNGETLRAIPSPDLASIAGGFALNRLQVGLTVTVPDHRRENK